MISALRRLMIFGCPGSGKSTFAFKVHEATGLPVYHLDKYFYQANWVERDYQEFLTLQESLVHQEAWIIDGNCTKSLEMRYARASMAIYFNFPLWLCYYRVIKRLFTKDPRIDDRAKGCPETVRFQLLWYMGTYKQRVHPAIDFLKKTYPQVAFMEVKSFRELKALEAKIIFNT